MNNVLSKVRAAVSDPSTVIITGVLVLAFSIAGPFGTFDGMPFTGRLTYWSVIIFLSLFLSQFCYFTLAEHWYPRNNIVHEAATVFSFSVIFAPLVYGLNTYIVGNFDRGCSQFVATFTLVSAIAVLVSIIRSFVVVAPVITPLPPQPRLTLRLQGYLGGSISRLTVDDHYVEVYLHDNSCFRLLMRFADAVAEMDDTPGFCVHRSHWVALDQIRSGLRKGGKEWLILICGTHIPVSKTYRHNAVSAGFL